MRLPLYGGFCKEMLISSIACRVFLNGKIHNEYRKGLNVLFTPQALS